jgi:hypothetical protein
MAVSTFGARPMMPASAASALGGLSMGGKPFRARGGVIAAPGATVTMPASAAATLGGLSMGGKPFNARGNVSYYSSRDAGVPVQPAPKPPKQAPAFSIDDDPMVRAARAALPGLVENAQKSARNSIVARLLQYGDPNLNGILDQGAAKQMLANLGIGKLDGQALDLLSLDPETQRQIAQAYGAEADPGVARDVGPSGISQKAQFDRSVAQAWRQRLGNLTGRGAVRSGDFGYQSREQEINRDVGIQNLVQSLLGGIGSDVSGVDTARSAGQKAIDDAIQAAYSRVAANPDYLANLYGPTKPAAPPDTTPVVTQTPSALQPSPLQQAVGTDPYKILQAVLGGRR